MQLRRRAVLHHLRRVFPPVADGRTSRRRGRAGCPPRLRRHRPGRAVARAGLQQAGRRSDHPRRPRRPPDRVRIAAAAEGRALDRDRPPRHQHHRPAAGPHRR
ncbi:hypothetical protein G6F50_015378 [Rhizopus delemar]|uniref:Uncharacterized protein n=1 Tax=Rhizopus delemar TaxID=936053 RepID=A0A9P6XYS7_9FUNG|nr:hypothetical protein G6F50_015378 [Rhizopus delemar]